MEIVCLCLCIIHVTVCIIHAIESAESGGVCD